MVLGEMAASISSGSMLRWLNMAFVGSMALHMTVIYVPFMRRIFHTQPLGARDWFAVVAAALVPIVLIDITKLVLAKKRR